ncbi:MAG TPA: hypothetical protein VFY23_08685 [Candidatus Limnocylindrales bacterium]|nr:hypothetical protein [Candidatus Limnocylindrales bacterium]
MTRASAAPEIAATSEAAGSPPADLPRPALRMRWGATITAAVVVTLVRPLSWAVGLAGFLAGGGLVLVTWPILVLPTPTGLQNALGGPVSSLVFGAPSGTLVALIVGGFAGGVVLLAAGLLVGAWGERQGIALALEAAAEEGIVTPAPDLAGAPGAGRIAVIRALSLAPVLAALLLSWRTIYDVTYRELLFPDDLVAPLPIRVLGEVPWLVVGVLATWILADAAGAVGVRRLVLERRPVLVAWLLGYADLVRRVHRVVPTALVGIGAIVLLAGPGLLAATAGWARVREVLLDGRDPLTVLGAVVIWVAVWLGALVLAGVAAAFRVASWTFELPRPGEVRRD